MNTDLPQIKLIAKCPKCDCLNHLGNIGFKNVICKCGERIMNPNVEHYVAILNEEYEKLKNKWNPKPLSLAEQFEALKEKWDREQKKS